MTITYDTFLKLLDTPATGSYNGNAGMGVAVNAAENALEFVGIFTDGGESMGAARSLGNNDLYDLSFRTNNAARMTIGASGTVGIGCAAMTEALEVNGDISMIAGEANQDRTLHFASDAYLFWDESEDAFYLYHAKPLFIGTMGFGGPDELLHVFAQDDAYIMVDTDRGTAGLKLNNSAGSGEGLVIFQEYSATKWTFGYSVADDELSVYNDVQDQKELSFLDAGGIRIDTPLDVSTGLTKLLGETGNDGIIRHADEDAVRLFVGAPLVPLVYDTSNEATSPGTSYTTGTVMVYTVPTGETHDIVLSATFVIWGNNARDQIATGRWHRNGNMLGGAPTVGNNAGDRMNLHLAHIDAGRTAGTHTYVAMLKKNNGGDTVSAGATAPSWVMGWKQ